MSKCGYNFLCKFLPSSVFCIVWWYYVALESLELIGGYDKKKKIRIKISCSVKLFAKGDIAIKIRFD